MIKKVTFLFLGLLLILVLLVAVNQSRIATIILSKVALEAHKKKVALQFESPSFALFGLSAKGLSVSAQAGPMIISLPFSDVRTLVGLFSLFRSDKEAYFSAKLFSGTLDLKLSAINLKEQSARLLAKISDVDLSRLDLLTFAGVSSAKLSLNTQDFLLQKNGLRGKVDLEIKDLNKPGTNTIPALLTGLPLNLEIPEIINTNLKSEIEVSPVEVSFRSAQLNSNLLTIKNGQGEIRYKPNSNYAWVESYNFKGNFVLSDTGLTVLGSYLQIFGIKAISQQEYEFSVSQKLGLQPFPLFKAWPAGTNPLDFSTETDPV